MDEPRYDPAKGYGVLNDEEMNAMALIALCIWVMSVFFGEPLDLWSGETRRPATWGSTMSHLGTFLCEYESAYGTLPYDNWGQEYSLYMLSLDVDNFESIITSREFERGKCVPFRFDHGERRVTDLAIDYLNPPPELVLPQADPIVLIVKRFGKAELAGRAKALEFLASDYGVYRLEVPASDARPARYFLGKRLSELESAEREPEKLTEVSESTRRIIMDNPR